MKIICRCSNILSAMCSGAKKWGCYVSNLAPDVTSQESYDRDVKKILAAAPWLGRLSESERFDIMTEGFCYILFDTEREMVTLYNETVGDDGPTATNDSTGWACYCLTCSNSGALLNENT